MNLDSNDMDIDDDLVIVIKDEDDDRICFDGREGLVSFVIMVSLNILFV